MTNVPGQSPPDTPLSNGGKSLLLISAVLLVTTALVPMEIGFFLAAINVILLWMTLAVPFGRSMSRDAEGAQKLFFGCLGILTAGVGAILLVGFSCALPLSKANFH